MFFLLSKMNSFQLLSPPTKIEVKNIDFCFFNDFPFDNRSTFLTHLKISCQVKDLDCESAVSVQTIWKLSSFCKYYIWRAYILGSKSIFSPSEFEPKKNRLSLSSISTFWLIGYSPLEMIEISCIKLSVFHFQRVQNPSLFLFYSNRIKCSKLVECRNSSSICWILILLRKD